MATASPAKLLYTLARAAGKAATSKLRLAGFVPEANDWAAKAEICERCPLRVVKCTVSYCGQPLLRNLVRDPVTDGCGCPTLRQGERPVGALPHHAPPRGQHRRCGVPVQVVRRHAAATAARRGVKSAPFCRPT
ncbi:MAG: hypothetical protein QM754_11245 [Tepidisphaeraceae bacterium]